MAATIVLVTACGTDEPWRTRDISGLMPSLAFELGGAGREPFTATELSGKATLLAFGYTSCPDVCPTTLTRLAALKRRLAPEQAADTEILFVSVDPRRDTPRRIAEFTAYFDPAIRGITGSEAQLQALTRRYRTTFGYGEPDEGGFYEVTHSSGIYVFDRERELRLLFRPDDPMAAMKADLVRLLEE